MYNKCYLSPGSFILQRDLLIASKKTDRSIMKWRKRNRWIHRKLGYLFFGMAIVYGMSGIALNHHIARHWTPSHIEKSDTIEGINPVDRDEVTKDYIQEILEITDEKDNYKQFYFPGDNSLIIYLKNGHISVNLDTGGALIVKISNRKIFREVNFLHYNKPKKLWTYFSDLFAFSMVALAITGLFMVKGKKGVGGQNAILLAIGVIIPLLFLIVHLWT